MSNENRSEDLIGGIKNAIERGSTLEAAKKSLVNAGYKQEEVELASQRFSSGTIISRQIGPEITPSNKVPLPSVVRQIEPQKTRKGGLSKTLIIILCVVSGLILIGALLLGLYWDTLF